MAWNIEQQAGQIQIAPAGRKFFGFLKKVRHSRGLSA
jgi:hypothetical protein